MANKRIKDLTEKSSFTTGDYFPIDNANGTKKVNASKIMTPLSNVQAEVSGSSDAYKTTKAYKVGDVVIYNNTLYQCTTACSAGSWSANQNCFTATTLATAVTQLNNDLKANTFDALISPISNPTSEYTAPSDGYYRALLTTSATNNDYVSIAINGITISQIFGHSGGVVEHCVFVRKGMKCKIATSNTNIAQAAFYPIHQT